MKIQRKTFSHDPIPDMSFSCVFSFLSAGSKQWPVSGFLCFWGFFLFFVIFLFLRWAIVDFIYTTGKDRK